jgi:putative ABC transport system substrate-binding protein
VADSLAKPGRNVTGNAIYTETGVWGKMLQLLREAKPDIKRVGILWTYVIPAFPKEEIEPCFAGLNSAARSLNLELHIVEVANSDQPQAALAEIDEWKPGGLLLTSFFSDQARSVVMQFAVDKGLPSIVDVDVWTRIAAPLYPLLFYGPINRELVQNAVTSVDKILRGSSPGDLPIQRPRRFELIVNLKTAKAIGLDLPPVIFAQADRVIE